MLTFILQIIKAILLKLATTGAFSFMMPWLLKEDKWLEDRLGIDIIKQDKKFQKKLINAEYQFWTNHIQKDVPPDDYVDFQTLEEVI